MQPAAAHLASVPPHPNSTSSGWAPIARADAGRREVRELMPELVTPRLARLVRGHAEHLLDGRHGEVGRHVDVPAERPIAPDPHAETEAAGLGDVAPEGAGP